MKRRLLVATALVAAVGLSGCALGAGNGPTSEQARERFHEALDDTQDALGGSWKNQDDPTSRGCSVALWVEGISYPGLRIGPMPGDVPGDVSKAIDTARDTLGDLGFKIDASEDVGEVLELRATRDGGEFVLFRITDEGMTLQGESACRPQ